MIIKRSPTLNRSEFSIFKLLLIIFLDQTGRVSY